MATLMSDVIPTMDTYGASAHSSVNDAVRHSTQQLTSWSRENSANQHHDRTLDAVRAGDMHQTTLTYNSERNLSDKISDTNAHIWGLERSMTEMRVENLKAMAELSKEQAVAAKYNETYNQQKDHQELLRLAYAQPVQAPTVIVTEQTSRPTTISRASSAGNE